MNEQCSRQNPSETKKNLEKKYFTRQTFVPFFDKKIVVLFRKCKTLSTSKNNTNSFLNYPFKAMININFFSFCNKFYLTTSFIFILPFSSEKSDTGTKFILGMFYM